MKKKIIICIIVLLVIIVSSILLINKFYYTKDAKTIRDLFNNINDNVYKNGIDINFKESFNLEYDDYYLEYISNGSKKLSFELDKSINKNELNNSYLLHNGNGYLILNEYEKYIYHNKEDDKLEDINYELNNDYIFKIEDNKLYSSLKYKYIDNLNNKNSSNKELNGLVNIKDLSIELQDDNLNDINIYYLEIWDYINEINSLVDIYFKELDFKYAKEYKNFIKDNDINIDYNDNILDINFKLNTKDILDKVSDYKFNEYPYIEGNIRIDKDSYEVLYFKYDLSNYLLMLLEKDNSNKDNFKAHIEEFYVEGKYVNKTLEDLNLDTKFINYDKNNIKDYINKFNEIINKD